MIAGKIDPHLASGTVLHRIMHRFLHDPIKLRCHGRANRKRGGVGFDDAVNTAILPHTRCERLEGRFQISVGSLEAACGEPGLPGCFIGKPDDRKS